MSSSDARRSVDFEPVIIEWYGGDTSHVTAPRYTNKAVLPNWGPTPHGGYGRSVYQYPGD